MANSKHIEITTYTDVMGHEPKRVRTTTATLFDRFQAPIVLPVHVQTKEQLDAEKKNTRMWLPATFVGNVRKLASFEGAHGVGFDIDRDGEVPGIDEIEAVLAAYYGFVHTTMSSTDAAPRFRAMLWTNRVITADEYRALHEHIGASIPGLAKGVNDPSRQWAVPCIRHGGVYRIRELQGEPVDVDAVLEERRVRMLDRQGGAVTRTSAPSAVERPNYVPGLGGRLSVAWSPYDRARAWLAKRGGWVCPHGATRPVCRAQRCHSELFGVAVVLVRGFDLDDFRALGALHEWNAHCSPGFSDDYFTEQIDRARKHGDLEFGAYLNAQRRAS